MKKNFKINGNPATETEILAFLGERKATAECDYVSYQDEFQRVEIGWFFDQGWQICRILPDGNSFGSERKYSPEEILVWYREYSDSLNWADHETCFELEEPPKKVKSRLSIILGTGIPLIAGALWANGQLSPIGFIMALAATTLILLRCHSCHL